MGQTFLIISVLLQACAVVQAVRLAMQRKRVGWIFLALANALMLVRRGLTLSAILSQRQPEDQVSDSLALLISLLMVVGLTLLLSWFKTQAAADDSTAAIQNGARGRMLRQALLLSLLAMLGCAGLSYFAYHSSREAVTRRLLNGSLDLAHLLDTTVSSASNQAAALEVIAQLWRNTPSQYADNYLCVIGADGKLLLNTRRPEMVGTFVGATAIPGGQDAPRTVQELVTAGRDWAGRNLNSEGEPQIAAYVYSPHLKALVAIHMPGRSVDAEIRAAALPWGAGIALIFLIVLPLSFGLLFYVGSTSQKAAFQALLRQQASERQYSQLIENIKDHAIFLLDAEGRVTTWNPGAETVRGWTQAEIQGRPFATFYPPEDVACQQPEKDLQSAAAHGSMTTEGWRLRSDGSRFWASNAISVGRDEAGRPSGYLVVTRDLTERNQAEAKLQNSFSTLQLLVDSVPHFIAFVDAEERYQLVNRNYEEWFARPRDQILGRTLRELHRPATYANMAPHIREVMAGRPVSFENRIPGRDGKDYFFDVRYVPRHSPDGTVMGYFVLAMDITERTQAAQIVRQLNRTYRVLSDINQLIVRERDSQKLLEEACRIAVTKGGFKLAWIGRLDMAGQRLKIEAHAGASTETLRKLDGIINAAPPDTGCSFARQALATGEHAVCNDIESDPQAVCWRDAALRRDYHSLVSLPLRSGDRVIGTFNLYAVAPGFFDADELQLLDELAADISFALDVSRNENVRLNAEAARDALLELQLKLNTARVPLELARSIFAAADQLWSVDAGTLNIYLPEQDLMQAVLNIDVVEGRRQDVRVVEFIGQPSPGVRRIMAHGAELELRQPPFKPREGKVMFGDTTRLSASLMHVPIRWQGSAVGILSVQSYALNAYTEEDLRTLQGLADHCGGALERIRADAALRDSEERFQELATNISEVFWITDPAAKKVFYVSPAYEKIWGRTCASVYESPRNWIEAIAIEDRARVIQALETQIIIGTYDQTYRILRPDGKVRWIHDRGFPVRSAAGEIVRLVGTAADVTEQRELEEQFRQSQKMEAIGQLAGGVAHDFNNILAAIVMQVELAAAEPNLPAETRGLLDEIKAAAEQAASLTRQLLAFSRRQVMQTCQLDLNKCVSNLTKMLQRIVGEDVRLQLNFHPHVLLTRADAGMLEQVLLNLVVNARDAMPGGGQLAIETGEKTFTQAEAALIPDALPGRHVWLRVSDSGCGIAPEHLPHIFEPFFTTKELGKGTGLGLATVFGIVKQHCGALTVESRVGQGTIFQIFLRAEVAADLRRPVESVLSKPPGGTETILVVEDDPSVRTLTRTVLSRAGYQVIEAANGVEALRLWEQHKDSVQLLFTDMVMPEGVSGRQLAARLLACHPKLRVVFTSGHSADFAGQELALQPGQCYIQKPATPRQMLEAIRQCLDG